MNEFNSQYPNNNGYPQQGNNAFQNSGAPSGQYDSPFAPPPQNNGYAQPPMGNIYNVPPPQPPKKKSSCLVFAIIGAILAVLLVVIIVIAVALFFVLRGKTDNSSSSKTSNFNSYLYSSGVSPAESSGKSAGASKSSSSKADPSSEPEQSSKPAVKKDDYQPAIDKLLDSADADELFYAGYGDADLEWGEFDIDEDGIPEVIISCTSYYEDGYTYKSGLMFSYDGKQYKQTGSTFSLPVNDSSYPLYDTETKTLLTRYASADDGYEFYSVLSFSKGYLYTQDTFSAYPSVDSYTHSDASISKAEYQSLVKEYKQQCTQKMSYTYFKHYDAPPRVEYIAEATVITQKDPLNMRSGPGKDYDVIFKVPKDGIVYIIEWDGDWAYAEYYTESDGKRTGYLSKEFLKVIYTY